MFKRNHGKSFNLLWIQTHISFKSRLQSRRGKSINFCFFFICVRAYFFATIRKRLIVSWDDNTIDKSGFVIWTVTLLLIETPRGVTRFITDLWITGCRGNRPSVHWSSDQTTWRHNLVSLPQSPETVYLEIEQVLHEEKRSEKKKLSFCNYLTAYHTYWTAKIRGKNFRVI